MAQFMKDELTKFIHTDSASLHMRNKVKANEKFLIANLTDSLEEKDAYTKLNCNGYGRIRRFKDYLYHIENLQNTISPNRGGFFSGFDSLNGVNTQTFQLAGCSWRCWYCYVDYNRLSGNKKYGQFFSAKELINMYLDDKNTSLNVVDLSGGQPDLVPEWPLWVLKELASRNHEAKVYVRSEDNLSNEFLWEYLLPSEIKWLAEHPLYTRIACFKGFDEESFAYNTGASGLLFNRQFKILNRLHKENFDLYVYTTFTSLAYKNIEEKIKSFIDHLQIIHQNFPLRTVPLMVTPFFANRDRKPHSISSLKQDQLNVWEIWSEELQKRFSTQELATPFSKVIIK